MVSHADAEPTGVSRVAVGTPEEPFAAPWRFWTHGDSAYLSVRVLGATYKASFHPADEKHEPATWIGAFTRESGVVLQPHGGRRSDTWPLEPEIAPGWHRGPAIAFPRLPDRKYDLPWSRDLSDVLWVPAPAAGHARFLNVFLTDARDDLPPLQVPEGIWQVGALPMTNGWHLAVHTSERPLQDDELAIAKKVTDEMRIGISGGAPRQDPSGAIVWVTTSPQGPPLFVHIVLGSENFYEERASGDSGTA